MSPLHKGYVGVNDTPLCSLLTSICRPAHIHMQACSHFHTHSKLVCEPPDKTPCYQTTAVFKITVFILISSIKLYFSLSFI